MKQNKEDKGCKIASLAELEKDAPEKKGGE